VFALLEGDLVKAGLDLLYALRKDYTKGGRGGLPRLIRLQWSDGE
jgi:hypothetical protein